MAIVKFDVTDVDVSQGEFEPARPGMYIAEIIEVDGSWTGKNGAGFEVVLKVLSNSKGETKDIKGIGSQLWTYIYTDYEPTAWKLAEFLLAVGIDNKKKGQFNTDKIVGTKVQVRVKSDKDLDGDYRPKVGKLLALAEDSPEPEEPEEDEDAEAEGEDGEELDLSELDRAELKKLIKDEELEIKVLKSMSDDDLRDAIAEAMSEDEDEEEEAEDEEEEDEEEDDNSIDLSELDRTALKALIKERELEVKVLKKDSDDDLREKITAALGEAGEEDEEEDDDAKPDYDSWEPEQLKSEIKERGLELKGRFSKAKAAQLLRTDDADDGDPF